MSVINQMLQDLEGRRNRALGDSSLPVQIRAVPRRGRDFRAGWTALGVAMVAGIAVSAWWMLRPAGDAATGPAPVVATPESIAPPPVTAAPTHAPDVAREARTLPPAPLPAVIERRRQAPEATVADGSALAGEPVATPRDDAAVAAVAARPDARAATSSAEPSTVPATKQLTAQQSTENEYVRAMALAQAGQSAEAITSLGYVVQLEPGNATAREALVGLLVEAREYGEAARRLQDGLAQDPGQTRMAMILARLQVEQGDAPAARATLQRSLPHAAERSDYLAFLAALLQREGRHKEAIEQYRRALGSEPTSGVWLMGMGLSLKAENRPDEARDSFARAIASNSLSPELRAYVEQQMK